MRGRAVFKLHVYYLIINSVVACMVNAFSDNVFLFVNYFVYVSASKTSRSTNYCFLYAFGVYFIRII